MRKSLRRREFDRPVESRGAAKAARSASSRDVTIARRTFGSSRLVPSRIKQEVCVTVVERPVFNHISHMTIDPARTDNEILSDLVLDAHAVLANTLRFETGIKWRRIGAEIHRRKACRNRGIGRSIQPVHVEVL